MAMIHTAYISSHDRWAALYVASALSKAGFQVASSWHNEPMKRTATLTEDERAQKAANNANQIIAADVLVLVAAADKVPGGKFVEAGIAIGQSKPVVILGQRENILLHHPLVSQADDIDGLIVALKG